MFFFNFLVHVLTTQLLYFSDPIFWVMFAILFLANYCIFRWVPIHRLPFSIGLLAIPSGVLSWGLWLSHW